MMRNTLATLTAAAFMAVSAGAATVNVTASAGGTGTTTWTSGNEYVLDGHVFVNSGQTLTIEAGTVIKGKPGTGASSSALIVARGGTIMAMGEADDPIIMTAEADDVSDPDDMALFATGQWGGLIVLGAATVNYSTGTGQIEGIPETEARGAFGGTDDTDNSGVIRYVSIRHAGTEIGAGNEINGLTMGAVGSGTVIEYVEVYCNQDDGFEWFGGTVNTKYLASCFNNDDSYDYDHGFVGKGQFWFAIQGATTGDHVGEHDGGKDPDDATPYSIPVIYNATYIGSGESSGNDQSYAFYIEDNAGGKYRNSIFTEFPGYAFEKVEDLASGEDCRSRMENGDLVFANNIFGNIGAGSSLDSVTGLDYVRTHVNANHNTAADPMLNGVSRTADEGLDPRPAAGSPAFSNLASIPADGFFDQVDYKGAFGGTNWLRGWTYVDELGFLGDVAPTRTTVTVTASAGGTGTTTWTADHEYVLDGHVFVNDGQTLTIEAGTVIKGKPGTGASSSALIVARGGKIMAEGTSVHPIIMTAEADDVSDPEDMALFATGQWGGLIVLGSATVNYSTGTGQIEGIPETEARGAFGGTSDTDNSGVIRYVSIRHAGTEIGAGNEINGLTMGAVGSGTTIDHIEVYCNQDDGFEWFGGTVNTKYLASVFNNDDSFDYDHGFTGKGQFWFAIQGATTGDHVGEHDGGKDPDDATPYSIPQIYNATYIGSGSSSPNDQSYAFYIEDNAGGKYRNSIFAQFPGYAFEKVEDLASGEDCRARMEGGDLAFANNIFAGIGAGATLDSVTGLDYVRTHINANDNVMADPQFAGISRTADGGLDPRPAADAVAQNLATVPSDGFFDQVGYKGAFAPVWQGNGSWLKGWTCIDELGFLASPTTGMDEVAAAPARGITLSHANPVVGTGAVSFRMDNAGSVNLSVYTMDGRLVSNLVNGTMGSGSHTVAWDAASVKSGMYLLNLTVDGTSRTSRVMVK